MKIEIIIIAVVAVVATLLVFVLLDRKKQKQEVEEQEEQQTPSFRKADDVIADYNEYQYKKREYFSIIVLSYPVLFLVAFIFYNSIIAALVFAFVAFFVPRLYKQVLINKRKQELSRQFQQALFSLSSSLIAGRSIENSFLEVTKDLYLLYPDPNTYIIREFEVINKKIANRETIESALVSFSERADIDDITNFTDVFVTCKRTGGDLVEVIRRTSNMINDKFEIQQEISVVVAQKRLESRILAVAPIAMIGLLAYSSGEYMAPLYSWSELGPLVMTVALAIIGLSIWLSSKIMNIKV